MENRSTMGERDQVPLRRQPGGRRWRRRGTFVVAVATLATLAACGDSDDTADGNTASGDDCVIGFSHPFADVPVVQVVNQLFEEAGKEAGCEVLLDSTQGGNLQEQLATLDTWVTQGVDAIIVNPIQPTAYESVAQRAIDDGIIWTTYAARMDVGAGGVGLPAKESGEATGAAAVEWIKANDPDAKVLILTAPELPDFADRVEIPKQMIEEQTDAEVVAEQAANEQTKGLTVTESALQGNPDISVVIGFNDDGALGAAEALRTAGQQSQSEVFVIGQDGSEDALKALKDPDSFFSASAALDLKALCDQLFELTKAAVDDGWEPGDPQVWKDIAPVVLTRNDQDQVDQFLANFGS